MNILQNGCRRPFWMPKTHFRWHFWPFQIHNIEKKKQRKNEDTISARKYKLEGRGTTKIHERIEENGSIHHLQSENKNAGREEQLQGEIQGY